MKRVTITEDNAVFTAMNNTQEYPIDQLPAWFKPLQSILDDRAFTQMVIQLEDVAYIIRPVETTDTVTK